MTGRAMRAFVPRAGLMLAVVLALGVGGRPSGAGAGSEPERQLACRPELQEPAPAFADGFGEVRRSRWRRRLEAGASVRADFVLPVLGRVLSGLTSQSLRTSPSKSALPAAWLRAGAHRAAPSRFAATSQLSSGLSPPGVALARPFAEIGPPVRRHAEQRPGRIISLVPAVTEMLFAMGAGDAVVGVSSYDSYPAEAATRPRVGALIDPDVERILSLRPDLVIVYGTQDDLVARLTRAGIAMFPYEHAGLVDITATIRSVGRRVGRAEAADRVAGAIEADLDAIRAAVAGRPRPSTALLFGREQGELRGLFASGGVGFLHDMLVAAGGANAFADVRRQSAQISVETLLTRAPEVIMEVHPAAGWTPERIARERQVWNALTTVPAVRDERIYIVADDRMSVPGPRVAEAVRVMATLLHPDAFRKPGLFLSPQKQARLTRR